MTAVAVGVFAGLLGLGVLAVTIAQIDGRWILGAAVAIVILGVAQLNAWRTGQKL